MCKRGCDKIRLMISYLKRNKWQADFSFDIPSFLLLIINSPYIFKQFLVESMVA